MLACQRHLSAYVSNKDSMPVNNLRQLWTAVKHGIYGLALQCAHVVNDISVDLVTKFASTN